MNTYVHLLCNLTKHALKFRDNKFSHRYTLDAEDKYFDAILFQY